MENTSLINPGDSHLHDFSFSQAEVAAFAQVTGDHNPLHLDADYAARTFFKRPIMHGMLGASVFSKLLGTVFPGEGTVYLKQELNFLLPMYAGEAYQAQITVQEVDRRRHKAVVLTQVLHKESGKLTIDGKAEVMHREKI